MQRTLLLSLAAALAAAGLRAQCLTVTGSPVTLVATTAFYTPDDEGLSAPLALGFAFPIGGGTFTHVSVESNGVLYLTNGGAPVGTTNYGTQDMGGTAGDSPRIACYWTDLEGVSPNWSVQMDTSVPGECKISWVNVNEYLQLGAFTVQATLYSTGVVNITQSAGLQPLNFQVTSGVSAANGIVATSSDLSTGPSSTIAALYEDFFFGAPIDIANTTTSIIPTGIGYLATTTCVGPPPAAHTEYGEGCYRLTASFYEFFLSGTIDLSGSGMSMLLNGGRYTMLPAVTTYVPPPATATALVLGDDTDVTVPFTGSFPYPGGSTSAFTVCSNGFVSAGPGNFTSFTPDPLEFTTSPQACWRGAWHDFYPLGTSGQVKFHQTGSIVYITWDGVFDYGTTTPETFQMQFDTATGNVHVLWVALTGGGNDFLVGFAPVGPVLDPGSSDLSAVIPTTFSTATADVEPLALSAAPVPISTPTTGSVVTYTTDNMPAFSPGVYVGLLIFSGGQSPAPGLDLGFLGAPGCRVHVASIDVTIALVGVTPSQSVNLPIPAGVPIGTTIYAQSAALFPPNSLPNGQNAFGLVTSNGVSSFISTQ